MAVEGFFRLDGRSPLGERVKRVAMLLVDAVPDDADPSVAMSAMLSLITSYAKAIDMTVDQLVEAIRLDFAINRNESGAV